MAGSSSNDNSADAFLAVVLAEHRGALVKFILYMRVHRQDMEDILQEALHGAVLARHRYDPASGSLRSWLLGIAANHVIRHLSRAHRRREVLCPFDQLETADARAESSEALLIAGGRKDLLYTLLADVPIRRRSVLVAHDLLQMSMEEVAAALGINVATAWSRRSVALRELKAAAARWRAARRGRGEDDEAATPPVAPRTGPIQILCAAALAAILGAIGPSDSGDDPCPWPRRAANAVMPAAVAVLPSMPSFSNDRSPDSPPVYPAATGASHAERRAAPRPARPRRAAKSRSITAEAKLVVRAAAALAGHQRNEARRLLEQHARAYPRGALAPQRDQLLRAVDVGRDSAFDPRGGSHRPDLDIWGSGSPAGALRPKPHLEAKVSHHAQPL